MNNLFSGLNFVFWGATVLGHFSQGNFKFFVVSQTWWITQLPSPTIKKLPTALNKGIVKWWNQERWPYFWGLTISEFINQHKLRTVLAVPSTTLNRLSHHLNHPTSFWFYVCLGIYSSLHCMLLSSVAGVLINTVCNSKLLLFVQILGLSWYTEAATGGAL